MGLGQSVHNKTLYTPKNEWRPKWLLLGNECNYFKPYCENPMRSCNMPRNNNSRFHLKFLLSSTWSIRRRIWITKTFTSERTDISQIIKTRLFNIHSKIWTSLPKHGRIKPLLVQKQFYSIVMQVLILCSSIIYSYGLYAGKNNDAHNPQHPIITPRHLSSPEGKNCRC